MCPFYRFTEPQHTRKQAMAINCFDIKNHTHAIWTWHHNQDGEAVVPDSGILYNKVWYL